MNTRNQNLTAAEAEALLAQADASTRSAQQSDAWPIVVLEMALGAGLSLGLLAQAFLDGTPAGVVMILAGLAWMVPGFAIYGPHARGWQRGSTGRFATFLAVVIVCLVLGTLLFDRLALAWIPILGAAVIWIVTPIAALLELRGSSR